MFGTEALRSLAEAQREAARLRAEQQAEERREKERQEAAEKARRDDAIRRLMQGPRL